MPVPFSPFRRNSKLGFDPYAETPSGGSHHSPSGATHPDDAPHLEPPEPPQLVLPSLARRLSSIVKQEASASCMNSAVRPITQSSILLDPRGTQ